MGRKKIEGQWRVSVSRPPKTPDTCRLVELRIIDGPDGEYLNKPVVSFVQCRDPERTKEQIAQASLMSVSREMSALLRVFVKWDEQRHKALADFSQLDVMARDARALLDFIEETNKRSNKFNEEIH